MRTAVPMIFSFFAVAAVAAAAAEPAFKLANANAPIEYAAAECNGEQTPGAKELTLVCTGNVTIRQGDVRLRADRVSIHSPDGRAADRIVAQGHVVIDSPSGTATGDTGTYDVTPRIVTLTGRVVLVKDASVMRGETLRVDLISGVAKFAGGAESGGRIQGMFTPKSSDDGKK